MKKKYIVFLVIMTLSLLLCGCESAGSKSTDISVVYICTSVASGILLLSYCCFIKQRNMWFLLLFVSVCVVNCGYLMLALSKTLTHALWANRLSYFGSVFLPFSMLMIILNVCRFRYRRFLPILLLFLSVAMFFIAASPGYSDIYYRHVSLEFVNGTAVLCKEYGTWHMLYFVYLLGYFSSMIVLVLCALARKHASVLQALLLTVSVFVNIGVWLLEQFVKIDVELLSVSYIVSELFLLMLYLLLEHYGKPLAKPCDVSKEETHADEPPDTDDFSFFAANLSTLTPTERTIYRLYLNRKSTKDVLSELNIKENTLKYHNKNIYSKLGVSSRKQLIRIGLSLQAGSYTQDDV